MKKTISMMLAILMLAMILVVNVNAAAFKDVSDSAYYAVAAQKLSEKKILEGYPDGTFGPTRFITRAEMAAIVCRMINIELNKVNLKSPYTDVPDNHWAIPYIVAASNAKIINGDGDGTFRPEDNVKHEEALKMVVCALGLVGADIVIDPVDWSAPYLKIADEKGVSSNLIGKKGEKSTRGDVAVMVYNGIIPTVNAPKASPAGGTYKSSQKVTLTSDITGAKIYYTLNGNDPTINSTEYTGSINISKDTTLKAIAVFDDVVSDVFTAKYVLEISATVGKDDKYDFEGSDKPGSSTGGGNNNNNNNNNNDEDENEDSGPSQEDIEASAAICEELGFTLDAIENIPFTGKAATVIEIVKNAISLTLESATNDGVIVTKEYVRFTYNTDITEVKVIINTMDDDEIAEFKEQILMIDTYSLMTLADFFDINVDYLG